MNTNDLLTQVAVWPNFLSEEDCDRAIALCKKLTPIDGLVGVDDKDVVNSEIRSSEIWGFPPSEETDFIYSTLAKALKHVNQGFQFAIDGWSGGCQISRYSANQQGHYDWHLDIGTGLTSRRKVSMSLQLSSDDDYKGGELEFRAYASDKKVIRQKGTLIMFPSYLEHRVTPVTEGERFSLVVWVDGPPFQ